MVTNTNLVKDGDKFIFDVQDGVYGYNTSENRGADTFHPFKSSPNYDVLNFDVGEQGFNVKAYDYVSNSLKFNDRSQSLNVISYTLGGGTYGYSYTVTALKKCLLVCFIGLNKDTCNYIKTLEVGETTIVQSNSTYGSTNKQFTVFALEL